MEKERPHRRGRKVGQPSLGDQHLTGTKIPPYRVFKKQQEPVNQIANKKGKGQGLQELKKCNQYSPVFFSREREWWRGEGQRES